MRAALQRACGFSLPPQQLRAFMRAIPGYTELKPRPVWAVGLAAPTRGTPSPAQSIGRPCGSAGSAVPLRALERLVAGKSTLGFTPPTPASGTDRPPQSATSSVRAAPTVVAATGGGGGAAVADSERKELKGRSIARTSAVRRPHTAGARVGGSREGAATVDVPTAIRLGLQQLHHAGAQGLGRGRETGQRSESGRTLALRHAAARQSNVREVQPRVAAGTPLSHAAAATGTAPAAAEPQAAPVAAVGVSADPPSPSEPLAAALVRTPSHACGDGLVSPALPPSLRAFRRHHAVLCARPIALIGAVQPSPPASPVLSAASSEHEASRRRAASDADGSPMAVGIGARTAASECSERRAVPAQADDGACATPAGRSASCSDRGAARPAAAERARVKRCAYCADLVPASRSFPCGCRPGGEPAAAVYRVHGAASLRVGRRLARVGSSHARSVYERSRAPTMPVCLLMRTCVQPCFQRVWAIAPSLAWYDPNALSNDSSDSLGDHLASFGDPKRACLAPGGSRLSVLRPSQYPLQPPGLSVVAGSTSFRPLYHLRVSASVIERAAVFGLGESAAGRA
jgi:hypothetical protein